MGNINEKNASTDEEKEALRSLLEPVQQLDPWTDETELEERAVEAALLQGIETHSPSSPSPKKFQQASAPLSSGLSSGHDTSTHELVAVRGENSDLPREKNESCEETGNVSLPLSESIIPETFEAFGTKVSPPFASEIDVSTPFTGDIRSLDSVEEFTEHTALLNFGGPPLQESLIAESPEPLDEFQTGRMGKISEAITLRSIASDRAAAITEQVLEKSPSTLASNSLLVNPHQMSDIPIVPLPPPPMTKPMGASTAILSPLILGLSTLADIGDMELSYHSETENCKNNESPLLPGAPLKELINFEDTALDSIEIPVSPRVAPFAPRHETVPLPPLSVEDSANLFVLEIPSLEPSGLGLGVPTPPKPIFSAGHFSPSSLHVSDDTAESNLLLPSIASIGSTSESLAALAPQSEAQLSIQASPVEDGMELLQATISILNLDAPDNDTPSSTCQAARYAELLPHSSQKAQAVTPEANSPVSSLAISKIRTYADATDIAMGYPELAKVVIQAPLASKCPSTAIDQSTHKVEDREDAEHTLALPYMTKGPVERDISLISPRTAPSSGSVRGSVHTPNTPNWAVAPVLDSNSPLRSGKPQRGRGRRCGKKTRMSQRNGINLEDSRLISGPLKSLEATHSVSPKVVKEESPQSTPPPHDQLASSEELRKITLTNREKVNKWISESASVIGSPISGADLGSHTMASCSTFLMGSELEQVSDSLLGIGEDDILEKASLPPASRVAEASVTRGNPEKTLNDRILVEDDHDSKRTAGSIPTTIANTLVKGFASSEEDWKVNFSKGKQFLVRSPTSSACRSRSASIASSLASGVSVKSGVSASSRLFQRAIVEIGSKNGSRPIHGVLDSVTCHILPDRQHIEPRGTFNTVVQAPDPPSRKSSFLDSSMPINAVAGPERTITRDSTRDATLRAKGKVEAVTSSHQMVESRDRVETNDERFVFTFKPPQASIGEDDQNAYTGSQNYTGPLFEAPVEASVFQAPRSQQEGKTPRPSSNTFIPTGRYVPPPVRDNEMLHHGQDSATIRATVTTGNGAPIQQTKVPQLSWPCMDANAATIVTTPSGMNVHAPCYRSSDDVLVANFNEVRNDVMPDVRMHFGTGNGPSIGVQRIFPKECETVGRYGQSNPGSSLAIMPRIAATAHVNAHVNHSGSGVRSRGVMTPLDLPEAKQKQGISGPQIQMDAPVFQQQLDEYMAKLSLAQKRKQANMDDIMKNSTSGCGKAETFDSIAAAGINQKLEQASSTSFGPVAMRATRFSLQQPSTSIKHQPRFETQASARYPTQAQMLSDHSVVAQGIPSRFPTQPSSQNVDQSMFEEFCRRQRQETRTVYESVPSRLPRRKI